MRKRLSGLIASLLLIISFLVIRFPLFNLHGMKEMPLVLFVFAITIAVVATVVGANSLAVTSFIGYTFGFIFAYFSNKTNIETGQNSLWFIWIIVFICSILVGVVIVLYKTKKTRKKKVDYAKN